MHRYLLTIVKHLDQLKTVKRQCHKIYQVLLIWSKCNDFSKKIDFVKIFAKYSRASIVVDFANKLLAYLYISNSIDNCITAYCSLLYSNRRNFEIFVSFIYYYLLFLYLVLITFVFAVGPIPLFLHTVLSSLSFIIIFSFYILFWSLLYLVLLPYLSYCHFFHLLFLSLT